MSAGRAASSVQAGTSSAREAMHPAPALLTAPVRSHLHSDRPVRHSFHPSQSAARASHQTLHYQRKAGEAQDPGWPVRMKPLQQW